MFAKLYVPLNYDMDVMTIHSEPIMHYHVKHTYIHVHGGACFVIKFKYILIFGEIPETGD